jgi:hypothetical protein
LIDNPTLGLGRGELHLTGFRAEPLKPRGGNPIVEASGALVEQLMKIQVKEEERRIF